QQSGTTFTQRTIPQLGGPGAIIESQDNIEGQLDTIKIVEKGYVSTKQELEGKIATFEKTASDKQARLDEYNDFIYKNNLTKEPDTSNGKKSIGQYRLFLEEERGRLSGDKQGEIRAISDKLLLLAINPQTLQDEIAMVKKEIKPLREKLDKLNTNAKHEALQ